MLIVLVAVALKADRGWPMALAALQLDTVGVHVARTFDLQMIRVTYALMLAMWSYPMLVLLIAGTWRHRQRCRDNRDNRDDLNDVIRNRAECDLTGPLENIAR